MSARSKAPGRGWATAGFLLGISLSVAANVAHSYVVADGGHPPVGAQVAGAAFPIILLVVVEVLSRVAWPATWSWSAARYGGAGVVAVVAAVVSYGHMHGLLRSYGEDALTAAIGPLAIDGLMVVSSMALLAIGRGHGDPRADREVDHGDPLSVHVDRDPVHAGPAGYALWADMPPAELPGAAEVTPAADPGHIERDVQERPGDRVTLASEVRRRSGRSTRDLIADYLADHPHAAVAEIAREVGVSESTAKRHRRELRATTETRDPLVTHQATTEKEMTPR